MAVPVVPRQPELVEPAPYLGLVLPQHQLSLLLQQSVLFILVSFNPIRGFYKYYEIE